MKILVSMLFVVTMFFSQGSIYYAEAIEKTSTIENTGVLLDDPTLSKDQIIENKFEADQKDRGFALKAIPQGNILSGDPDGEGYVISVTNYAQENDNWCGPASARQSLSFHKVKSGSSTILPSQTTLADDIKVVSGGSTTSGIKNALNNYASTFGFSSDLYVVGDISNYSNPTYTLESRIKNDLRYATNAPILLLNTKYLPRYNGKEIRHYNTVSGYSYEYATNNKLIKMVDPHYTSSYRGVFWDPLGSTTLNGVSRAVYQADLAGSNYAMCY